MFHVVTFKKIKVACFFIETRCSSVSVVSIKFGVRQGSVLSPQLFAVYLNDIVSQLPVSQRCFVVLYADDILIMAPSVGMHS